MKARTLTGRVFRVVFISVFLILAAALTVLVRELYNYFTDIHYASLQNQTEAIAHGVEKYGAPFLTDLEHEDFEITWINSDGSMRFDTSDDAITQEEREAFTEAKAEGYGEHMSILPSLVEKNVYSAHRLEDGSVIIVSEQQHTFFSPIAGFVQRVAIIAAAAALLAFLVAKHFAARIVQPLVHIDLDDPQSGGNYAELAPLLNRIEAQQTELRQKELQLRNKQLEFEMTTGSMREGLVLLNREGDIISINKAACAVLGIDRSDVTSAALHDIVGIKALLSAAAKGESAETLLKMDESDYQANISPIISDGAVSGSVLLLFDITEHEKAEKLRREFTTNVSHELKTPLQSISGYAELIMNGMVRPDDIPGFGSRIFSEARRVTTLIDDIIKLSKLDDSMFDMQRQNVDLLEAVRAEVLEISPAADAADVHIDVRGTGTVLYAFPSLISAIVHNLCENAVKYNRRGGSVTVTVRDSDDRAELVVKDTGIGIPPEHIDRVFERFYRVDKSRSKEVGGTGLGLAIVKHAAKLLDADVTLESEPDKGTRISVKFPKQNKSTAENA